MKEGIDVLSLFDGLSGGQVALNRIGIKVNNYYASEIDKYAMTVANNNYPNTIQIGDVRNLKAKNYKNINLLIGGSPCQNFSFSGKREGMSGKHKGKKQKVEILSLKKYLRLKKQGFQFEGQSYLFWEFVRILRRSKPKYFMLENVMMSKKWEAVITKALGVEPIEINSELVSAQHRRRLYWTNIPNVQQPKDKRIYLKDIIEEGFVDRPKSLCVSASYFKGVSFDRYMNKNTRQVIFNYSSSGRGNGVVEHRHYEATKAHTLTKGGYSSRSFTGIYDKDGIRKLSVLECERLQTLDEGYTAGVSNSQRYKMIGNGWTIDVVAHIFKNLPYYKVKKKKKLVRRL